MKTLRFIFGNLLYLLPLAAQATVYIPLEAHLLSPTERKALAEQTCSQRHKVAVDSIQAYRLRRISREPANQATVRCQSHGKQLNDSAFYEVQCMGRGSSWNCEDSALVVTTEVHGRTYEVHSSIEDSLTAVALVRGLASQGHYFGQQPNRSTDTCYVDPLPTSDLYRVTCHGWQAIISNWCPQRTCPRLIESIPMWR
jgi:hypothetical protein